MRSLESGGWSQKAKTTYKTWRNPLILRRILIVILVIAIAGLAGFGIWLNSELNAPYYKAHTSETYVDIPRGVNTKDIASRLVKSGILKTRLPFMLFVRYRGLGRRIQAGEYRFSQATTPKQIAQRLVHGDTYVRSITVPEGLTAFETIELLAKNGVGNRLEMEQALLKTEWIQDLDPNAQNLEGYLFPETYRFGRKADSETIIKTMVQQFRIRISKAMEQYPLPDRWNLSRIVILASMIEKEMKKPEEGPLIASVYYNRLDRRMPLACDATIIYAMKLAGIYEGRLGKADLRRESPYNSYLHLNLPPSPIANPGSTSLRAALNPARTDYLYYVSRNDGTHQFSKDFRSHQNAVNRFQKSLASRRSGHR
jgi:UPF0755 protein